MALYTESELIGIRRQSSSCSTIRGMECEASQHQVDNREWPKSEINLKLIEKGYLKQGQQ